MCAQLNWFQWRRKWGKLERNSGARKGGIEGDSKLFGWGTKWIWIEMRVTADRNWDWGAFSLEHTTTIKNRILLWRLQWRRKKCTLYVLQKKLLSKTILVWFCWIFNHQELKSSVPEGNDHLYLLRCLASGEAASAIKSFWYFTTHLHACFNMSNHLVTKIFLWDGFWDFMFLMYYLGQLSQKSDFRKTAKNVVNISLCALEQGAKKGGGASST